VPEIHKSYPYWKIPVVLVFVGAILLAVNFHSEHWISFLKGLLFFSDQSDEQQRAWIRELCFYTTPVLSVLFLCIGNHISNFALITLMIILVLLVFPFGYVADPTETF
jgi:hypothetical protein